jgi:hypothetical protein
MGEGVSTGWGWWWLGWWSFGPDEFAVLVAFGEDADEAELAIKYAAYVGPRCEHHLAQHGSKTIELIFRRVPGAVVESVDACHCASCEFVQACAPGCVGRQSVGVHPCLGRL